MARFRPLLFSLSRARLDSDFGAWRSLVARTVRVGEVPGSNPGAPISRHLSLAGCVTWPPDVPSTIRRPVPCQRGSAACEIGAPSAPSTLFIEKERAPCSGSAPRTGAESAVPAGRTGWRAERGPCACARAGRSGARPCDGGRRSELDLPGSGGWKACGGSFAESWLGLMKRPYARAPSASTRSCTLVMCKKAQT